MRAEKVKLAHEGASRSERPGGRNRFLGPPRRPKAGEARKARLTPPNASFDPGGAHERLPDRRDAEKSSPKG